MISITNAYRGLKEFEQSCGTAFPQSWEQAPRPRTTGGARP